VVRQNWTDSDSKEDSDSSPDDTTMAPQSAHDDTGLAPAPSNNNSTSIGNSTRIDIAPTLDDAVVAVQAMEAHGMLNAEDVLQETSLTPAQLIDNVRVAEQRHLGPGWIRKQAQLNRAHAPPDASRDRRRFIEADYVQH